MRNITRSSALRRVGARGVSAVRLLLARGSGRSKPALRPAPVEPPVFEYIAADIVNNCNLRCPFCLVDYDQVRKTELMDEPTFRALLRLAPAVPEAGFWLSCLHEPTLHPRLAEYLGWIPVEQRRKFWFTTNLARPLPDSLIEAIARSGIHHVNVSLDTFDEPLFAILRKHGRLSVFRNNLERLIEQLRRTPGAPGRALHHDGVPFQSAGDPRARSLDERIRHGPRMRSPLHVQHREHLRRFSPRTLSAHGRVGSVASIARCAGLPQLRPGRATARLRSGGAVPAGKLVRHL